MNFWRSMWNFCRNVGGVLMVFFGIIGVLSWIFTSAGFDGGDKTATSDENPFSLACSTTLNSDGKTSYIRFKLTIEPRMGDYYQYDWSGYSTSADGRYTYNTGHRGMTDEIRKLSRINAEQIRSGAAVLYRTTGKYEYSDIVDGTCKKIQYRKIPRQSF
ncbi:hypothetical protein [Acuticoccus mangrovi]|uniref:Uncharacterized protein n=1 Tax=Acuticoccus mangrovi TaxID=2796142 RepID=A0A934MIZ3_9HYPH|nr:hypothetical protein [Acuticoccus mangrovi]MBJ3778390.1 hypothetical protein [Acuticoccus mangrovi]